MKNGPSRAIAEKKILITCGTGGVGKTTVSAALGLKAALNGKKVAVITIDPAKRLATSLGLAGLSHEPTDLTEGLQKALGRSVPGRFFALMPKSRESFIRLIRSLSDNETIIQKLIRNPILETFSQDFSGANEYLALEELDSLRKRGEFDLIILDTPPSRNTLSFLEAPQLLSRFFEEKFVRFLVLPANQLLAFGMRKTFSILEKLTGSGFMNQLFDFGEAMFAVQENFLKKLKSIHALLQSEEVGFILVGSPVPETAPELAHFLSRIHERGFHFEGILLNRSVSHLKTEQPGGEEDALIRALQARESDAIRALRANLGSNTSHLFFTRLPELARDVHDLKDLSTVSEHIDDEIP
jgi:anion-transporting  ArsA/GET3 family ATPase